MEPGMGFQMRLGCLLPLRDVGGCGWNSGSGSLLRVRCLLCLGAARGLRVGRGVVSARLPEARVKIGRAHV